MGDTIPCATYVITGAPRTKKTHQHIVFPGKHNRCAACGRPLGKPIVVASKTTQGWEKVAVLQLMAQRRGFTFSEPVNVKCLIYRDRAVGDLTNYQEAIHDALQTAEIITNDRLIHQVDGTRLLKDAENPRVEITITELRADKQGELFAAL